MDKSGQGNLGGASGAARLGRAFTYLNVKTVSGQVNGGC
jgi:hypothetical protein